MDAVVVYESMYGNTHLVAEAIADGLGGVPVLPVSDAAHVPASPDLIVVGGPTHMHGLASARSRRMAVEAGNDHGSAVVEPAASDGLGLRDWLHELPRRDGAHAAAFDTRLDKPAALTGVAAHGIARRLRHHGYRVLGTASFRVADADGPLVDGELDRARAWGRQLAAQFAGCGRDARVAAALRRCGPRLRTRSAADARGGPPAPPRRR